MLLFKLIKEYKVAISAGMIAALVAFSCMMLFVPKGTKPAPQNEMTPRSSETALPKVTNHQLDYQSGIERDLEQKIRDILARMVGMNKVVARVQATLEFKQVDNLLLANSDRTAAIISRLNASVLIDGQRIDGKYVSRSKEDLELATKLVKNAIGFQEGRDSLTIESAPFAEDDGVFGKDAAAAQQTSPLAQTLLLLACGLIAILFVYGVVIKPYFRWLTTNMQTGDITPKERSTVTERIEDKKDETITQKKSAKPMASPLKEQILTTARQDPKKMAAAIRQLLTSK